MPEKELNYIRSNEAAGSEKDGGVIVDAFENSLTNETGWTKFKNSFKPYEQEQLGIDPNLSDVEKMAIMTANSPLSRSLKSRHLQMIAIGGAIGTGLFIGSGSVLATGGPGGVLIAYSLIGSMIYCTVQSMGELAITFPVAGAFVTYNTRFIDPSWGFTMAWNYALQWLVVFPLELVAASVTIQYWNKHINPVAWVAIFYLLIALINFFGVRGYGEAEFIFSFIKVVAVVGFIFFGIIVIPGGGPNGHYYGAHYYHDPGSFAHGFKGVCSVFVTAAFAFAGTELVGLAAAETANPRKSLPKATKQVFWRITLFYIICLVLVGCLVKSTDKKLLSGDSSVDIRASPFVLAIKHQGIKGLPSVMNAVILIAVLSVGNSSVFASSRTLAALACAGHAPKFLGYIDRSGRPLYAICFQLVFGLLCFLSASEKRFTVLNWMLSLSGLSSIFTWGSINVCHLRFRRALHVQGRDTSEIAFTSQVGIYGAIWGAGLNILVLIAQFWIAVWPLGAKPNAEAFFLAYLGFVVVILFYAIHKIFWARNFNVYISAKDIDIDTGRRELDLELLKQEIAEEKAHIASKPFYYRVYHFWC